MDMNKLRELEMGKDVTVITTGDFQLVDVARGLRFPALTECTLPMNNFLQDQMLLGNLTVAGEKDAPKARGEAKNADELSYEGQLTHDAVRVEAAKEADPDLPKRPARNRRGNSSTGNEALTSSSAKPETEE